MKTHPTPRPGMSTPCQKLLVPSSTVPASRSCRAASERPCPRVCRMTSMPSGSSRACTARPTRSIRRVEANRPSSRPPMAWASPEMRIDAQSTKGSSWARGASVTSTTSACSRSLKGEAARSSRGAGVSPRPASPRRRSTNGLSGPVLSVADVSTSARFVAAKSRDTYDETSMGCAPTLQRCRLRLRRGRVAPALGGLSAAPPPARSGPPAPRLRPPARAPAPGCRTASSGRASSTRTVSSLCSSCSVSSHVLDAVAHRRPWSGGPHRWR